MDGEWRKVNTTGQLPFQYHIGIFTQNRQLLNANIRNDASNRFGQDANHRIDPTYSSGFLLESPVKRTS